MNKLPITLEKVRKLFGKITPKQFKFVFTPPPEVSGGFQENPEEILFLDKVENPPAAWGELIKLFYLFLRNKDLMVIKQTPGGKVFVFYYVFLRGFEYRIYTDPRNPAYNNLYSACLFGGDNRHNYTKCLAAMEKHIEQIGND